MSLTSTFRFLSTHPLTKSRKLGAIGRFSRWQIVSRLRPGIHEYDWVNGARFTVKRGETGLTGNIYTGLHEFADMGFLLHLLRPDDLFVDVGANIGSYSILAGASAGANGLAFEPVPDTWARLEENLRLNHMENRVTPLNQAVGAEPGQVRFSCDGDTVNHVLAEGETHADSVEVEIVTLDDALRGQSPMLIKIDVEGYEWPVVQGASRSLQNPSLRAVILELSGCHGRYGYQDAWVLDLMKQYGFQPFLYDPFRRELAGPGGEKQASGNSLFVRDLPFVHARLRNATPITVNGWVF